VVVRGDGSALVRETIDYDFGSNSRHGILRKIPEGRVPVSGAASGVTDIRARSGSAPADTQVSHPYGAAAIRIGNPDRTVTGRHRYVIEYRITGVVAGDQLAFNAIGSEWKVPIDEADIKMAAPYALSAVRCNQGASFATTRCDRVDVDGDSVTVHGSDLYEAEGITVYAKPGEPSVAPVTALPSDVDLRGGSDPSWWWRGIALVIGAGTVGYALGVMVVTWRARRAGRDLAWRGEGGAVDAVFGGPGLEVRPVGDVVADKQTTIQFVPPRDLTPAQGGLLHHESVTDDHRVAWLIQHAIDGWFEIEKFGKALRWTASDERWAAAPAPLQKIFAGRHRAPLTAYSEEFAKGWKLIDAELSHWQDTSGLWDRAAERRATKIATNVVAVGALAGAFGALALFLTAAVFASVAVVIPTASSVLVGAGVAALLNLGELAVRTPQGFAHRQLVEGFRRFFQVSEGRHAREAVDHGVLRLYSAWAVALGELDHWTRAMESAALPETTPGVSEAGRLGALSTAMQVASTEPPSSGLGRDGDSSSSSGGVGGGAGGGGGDSW